MSEAGETITDALISRGDIEVLRKCVSNERARVSHVGFVKLINAAKRDGTLTDIVASRQDLPDELKPFIGMLRAQPAPAAKQAAAGLIAERPLPPAELPGRRQPFPFSSRIHARLHVLRGALSLALDANRRSDSYPEAGTSKSSLMRSAGKFAAEAELNFCLRRLPGFAAGKTAKRNSVSLILVKQLGRRFQLMMLKRQIVNHVS